MGQFGRYSTNNPLENLPNVVMSFQDLKERKAGRKQEGEIAKDDLKERMLGRKVREEELKLKQDEVPAANRRITNEQVGIALNRVPKVDTPISPGEFALMDSTMRNFAKKNNITGMEKAIQPFKNFAQGRAKEGTTRYNTYKEAIASWPQLKKGPMDVIQKALDHAVEMGHKEDIEKYTKMFEAFNGDPNNPNEPPEIFKSIFSASYQHEQDLKRKAAIEEQKNLPKKAEAAIIRELSKPEPDPERLEKLGQMMTQGKTKEERLYPTTEGYQPRKDAIGKMKPKGEKSTQPRSMKTWTLPDGSNITIANNENPPEGAVPFKDPRMMKKDLAKAEETIIANMNDPRSEPHIKLFNENSDASHFYLFDPGKKEGVIRNFFGSSDDKTAKIKLPIIKGRQTTLKDLRETAKIHNKTLEQILKEYAEKQKKKQEKGKK